MTTAHHRPGLRHLAHRGWTKRGLWAWSMWPLSIVFGLLSGLRRWLYQNGWLKSEQVDALVVIVGNVMVGGVGKTPIVIALAQHLRQQGWIVGVVSRGYGRAGGDCREVQAGSAPAALGDEPVLIHRRAGVPVFVAPRRADAARALLTTYPGTNIILCDDGLQHYGLQRDVEICVFDDRGIGNGWLLPAGPLRERWPRAVDLVLHTGTQPAFEGFRARRTLADHAMRVDGSQVALAALQHPDALPLRAVAAVARPEQFFAMLRSVGLHVAEAMGLPDHDSFQSWNPQADRGFTVLCTEKDAIKLWRRNPEALAVPMQLEVEPGFFRALDELLRQRLQAKLSSHHGHTTSRTAGLPGHQGPA
jgi:tetraacyldisaccharide 4'-kinase